MEYSIFGLFTIDIPNFIYVKAILAKEFHIQPSELDRMPGWEYEMFMKELNKRIKEENKKNKEDEEKYKVKDMQRMAEDRNFNRMSGDVYKNIPKIQGMSDVSKMFNMSSPKDI